MPAKEEDAASTMTHYLSQLAVGFVMLIAIVAFAFATLGVAFRAAALFGGAPRYEARKIY